jgi:hypothetical protein
MNAEQSWRNLDWGMVLLFALVACLFWLSAPMNGDFAWSDAPRHALNGIFVLDLLREMPFDDPKGWAEQYYIRYPALSILFYPPLFSFVLAGFFQALGFSNATALGAVAVFHFAMMAAMYVIARRWMPRAYAVGAALALGAAPEIGLWGRQVMLDIPAYGWLLVSVVFLFRYLRTDRLVDLVATALLFLAALYTKQTAIFAVLPMAWLMVQVKGWSRLGSRHILIVAGVCVVLLLPLVAMQIEFGAVNTASALGSARDDASRGSVAAWTYYLTVMPQQLGWPVVILAGGYVLGIVVRRDWRLAGPESTFLLVWFVCGYLFFSFIMVREPRHDLMVLWPVVVAALLGLDRLVSAFPALRRVGVPGYVPPAAFGISMVVWSLLAVQVPYVEGYREAASAVADRAPPNSNVLFNGYRDGNFVFNMRASGRQDIGVLRADKLLLRVSIERERGVQVVDIAREELLGKLRRYRVGYVVSQPGFWTDLASMRVLAEVLEDPEQFRLVETIDTAANYKNTDKQLRVYKYLGNIADEAEPITLEMVGIGETFSE